MCSICDSFHTVKIESLCIHKKIQKNQIGLSDKTERKPLLISHAFTMSYPPHHLLKICLLLSSNCNALWNYTESLDRSDDVVSNLLS